MSRYGVSHVQLLLNWMKACRKGAIYGVLTLLNIVSNWLASPWADPESRESIEPDKKVISQIDLTIERYIHLKLRLYDYTQFSLDSSMSFDSHT